MVAFKIIITKTKESARVKELYSDICSVVKFQRWWVLKSKIFGQETIYSKEKKSLLMNDGLSKSAKI